MKLELLLILYAVKNKIEARARQRCYYQYLPVRVAEGFTLAEVLITLPIIGVVASLVIPALINDAQEAELHTAWKKAYSDIEQATKRLVMDNGGSTMGVCNTFLNGNDCLRDNYLNYLSYAKKCNDACNGSACWHYNNNWKTLTNSPVGPACGASAILNNGNLLQFHLSSSGISGWILVDVNGYNKPNTLGKDIFGISLLQNSIKPYGSDGASYQNRCPSDGWGCAAIYLYQ